MSIISKLHYEELIINILRFSLSFSQNSDISGRPSARFTGGFWRIAYETRKNDPFLEYMMNGTMIKYLKIVIQPAILGSRSRIIELRDVYVTMHRDNFNGVNNQPMTTFIELSPASMVQNGQTLFVKYWKVTDPDTEKVKPTVIEKITPEITNINWIHAETKETIQETTYKENIALTAQIENQESNLATITISKEDGTEFENGQKDLSFEEAISEDGKVELTTLEIKEQWQDFKTSDIDKLIAKIDHNGYHKKSSTLQIIPPPKVIVDFRPSKNYNGEYGFDYMRDKNKKDKLTYKDILGTNKTVINTTTKKKENKFTKYTTDSKYKELKCDFYDSIDLDWHKNPDGSQYEYIQSWLTIYPKETQTLSLQIETIENPKKLDLNFEYDKSLFKLNTDKIQAQSKGKKRLKNYLTIECLKEFSTDQVIKVMYQKRQLGQLNLLANAKSKRKKLEVVFVEVKTKLSKIKTGSSTGKKVFLTKYLQQAFIKPTIVVEPLDLTSDKIFNKKFDPKSKGYIDNRTGLHDYLNKKMGAKYKDYLKVYFIPDECPSFNKTGTKVGRVNGQAKDIPSDAVVLFNGHNTSTTTHESLHALGLYHTFSRDKNHPYSYEKGETYNIMDYSHQSRYGSKKRIITWLWQWKKLWNNTLVKSE